VGPRPITSDIRLNLAARAENVPLVRSMLGGLAQTLDMPAERVEDVKLAVTEACTNVVRHAYSDQDRGRIDVAADPDPEGLVIVVSDTGRGMVPNPTGGGPGLGLPLIAALTDGLEIEQEPGCGSRLRMFFRPTADRFPTA
jgi:serine/threonine-protein kinase RsbW